MADKRRRSPLKAGQCWLSRIAALLGILALVAAGSAVDAQGPAAQRPNNPEDPAISAAGVQNRDRNSAEVVRQQTSSSGAAAAAANIRVSSWLDDAEEQLSTGDMYLDSTDIELVDDVGDQGLQVVGLRFQGVAVPQGATILSAYIEFTADEADSGATSLQFRGQAADNAPAFAQVYYDISSRPKTAASVNWDNVPAWPAAGATHQTPDLSPVVQEIVNRSGWSSGQALAFLISGSGERTAVAYDANASSAALLHIEYSTGSTLAVTGITPNHAPNTGSVYISDLAGANFQSGATVHLSRSGQPNIQATNVLVVSANRITCDLDLTGVAPGAWNVVVSNPDSQVATLPNGFTVEQSGGASTIYLPFVIDNWPPVQTVMLYPVADATILEAYPEYSFGNTTDMWAGYDHCSETMGRTVRSLVRFNTAAIPPGASVAKATLHLFLVNSCDIGERTHVATIYRALGGWSEPSVNWYNQPDIGGAYGSATIPSRHWGWYAFDVTGLVSGWVNGSFANDGLFVRSNESSGNDSARLGFATREDGEEGGAWRPYLEVTYIGAVPVEQPPAAPQPAPGQDVAGHLGAESASCAAGPATAFSQYQRMDAPACVP